MKTQRRPNRYNRTRSATDANVAGEVDGSDEKALPDNGAISSTVEGGEEAAETNDVLESNSSAARAVAASGAVPALPRRRKRLELPPREPGLSEHIGRLTATVGAPAREIEPPAERAGSEGKGWRVWITYENAFFLAIFLLAIVTRFWDIGNRGIHHDESLHSVYGRNLYIGNGYVHDPMMHGPLQFHLIATMDWLFGTSDAVSRFASAFSGVWVVMSAFFLRRQMGRIPALIASFLLLISPSILYFSRMAREDSIYSAMEMIMIVGLWRFLTTRKPADFFIACAGLSLMYTIKETAYLTTAIVGILFLALFAYQAGYAILGALAGYGVAMGGLYLFVSNGMKNGSIPKLPDIPTTSPDYNTIMSFAGRFLAHPLVLGGTFITLAFIAAVVFLLYRERQRVLEDERAARFVKIRPGRVSAIPSRRVRSNNPAAETLSGNSHAETPVAVSVQEPPRLEEQPDGDWSESEEATEVWDPTRLDPKPGSLLAHYQEGSMPYLVGALFSRPKVLLIGFTIAASIFVVFYTVFFTDIPRGIASGLFASLGYWMAQQGVARGGQPWYYYLLLVPLYEPIALFFSIVAAIFFSWRGIRWLARNRAETRYEGGPRLGAFNIDRPVPFASFNAFLPLFLGSWVLGVFFLYSWAGEKMPWLVIHITRPLVFFAAIFLGALAVSLIKRRQARLREAREAEDIDTEVEQWQEPARGRRGARRLAVRPAYKQQEPPWIAWNRPGSRFPVIFYLAAFTVLVIAWGLSMNNLTSTSSYGQWGVTWVYPILMVALTVSYAVWLGAGRALRYLALGLFAVMFLYEFRSADQLVYNHPDVPTEMAVYVQTSPDTTRTVNELNKYSMLATGGLNLKVQYDSFTSWPFSWYLRDYKNAQFIGDQTPNPDASTAVLLLEYAKHTSNTDPLLQNYVAQRYAMRWWFPEDWYKNQLIQGLSYTSAPITSQAVAIAGTTASTFTNPQMQATLWKYLMFRELPMPLGSEDMMVFVRKDIAQQYHYIQYLPPDSRDLP